VRAAMVAAHRGGTIRFCRGDASERDRFPVGKLHNKREAAAHLFDRPSQRREVHVGTLSIAETCF